VEDEHKHPAKTLAGRMDFTVGCLRSPCLLASPHLILNTGVIKAIVNKSYKNTTEIDWREKEKMRRNCIMSCVWVHLKPYGI